MIFTFGLSRQPSQSQKSHEMTNATAASVTVEASKRSDCSRGQVMYVIGCSLIEHRWVIQVLPSDTEQNGLPHQGNTARQTRMLPIKNLMTL